MTIHGRPATLYELMKWSAKVEGPVVTHDVGRGFPVLAVAFGLKGRAIVARGKAPMVRGRSPWNTAHRQNQAL